MSQVLVRKVSMAYHQPVDIITVVFGHSLPSTNTSEEAAVLF